MKWLIFFICFALPALWAGPRVVAIFGESSCPWSQPLQENIWESPLFQAVLEKSGIGREIRKASGTETETPVLILLSSKGSEIGRIGYLVVPPEKYGELFNEMLQIEEISHHFDQLAVDQLLILYRKCRLLNMHLCEEKILNAGLLLDPGVDFLIEKYTKICKDHPRKAHKVKEEIRSRRPDAPSVEWQLAVTTFRAHQDKGKDIKEIARPLEKYLRRYGHQDSDSRWRCHLILGEFYKEKNQVDKAQHHIQQAIVDAPPELKQLITPLDIHE